MKKALTLLVVLVLTLTTITGCAKKPPETPVVETPKRNDITIGISSVITTLDPMVIFDKQQFLLNSAIFDTLVRLDEKGQPQPILAEKWEASADGLQLTFHLKKGVKFSNGEDLTADDVVFSIERFFKLPIGMYFGLFLGKIEKVDDYAVKFTMPAVYEGTFSALGRYIPILPKDYTEAKGDISLAAIGSGPYVVSEFIPGSEVKLVRNEAYHGTAAGIEKVTLKFIAETSTRIIALESGELDVVLDPAFEDRQSLMSNSKLKFEEVESYGRFIIAVTQYGKTADAKFREAIRSAINAEEIMQVMVDGYGTAIKSTLPPSVYKDYQGLVDMTSYDLDNAKKLLAESTFDVNTDELTITVLDPITGKIAEVIQNQLGKIGVKAKIDRIDIATYQQRLGTKTVEMAISFGGGTDFGPQEEIGGFTSAQDRIDRWPDNERIDSIYAQLIKTSDLSERKALVKEAYEEIKKMAIVIPLYTPYTMVAYNKDLKGLKIHPDNFYRISDFGW
jgi:peptide/nickel transport system substrate-binding protein